MWNAGEERPMRGITPIDANADWAVSWEVRAATHDDIAAVTTGVSELLLELGGTPPSRPALQQAAQALIDDPAAGVLLVAENEDEIVGVLGVSWQFAMRVPGRYGLIQELWVSPRWRAKAIGSDLLTALFELAREQGVARLEVGLPSVRFPHLTATESFYLNNGFTTIGTRMRHLLS
jgi:GNAT superfamily N-acetyltransferase